VSLLLWVKQFRITVVVVGICWFVGLPQKTQTHPSKESLTALSQESYTRSLLSKMGSMS
jgi:hypothetical protein